MFDVIGRVKDTSDCFELTDYLIYQDMVYHGTETEKNKISFQMLDLSGTGEVTKQVYESFWMQFLQMYSEMFSYKINLDDNAKSEANSAFNIISGGKQSFNFEMFEAAKK